MNTDLKEAAKSDFKKDFFNFVNNSVFEKTMENVQKHREIKLVITEKEKVIWYQNQIIMVWYGMGWYGMVWYGMVWYYMVYLYFLNQEFTFGFHEKIK